MLVMPRELRPARRPVSQGTLLTFLLAAALVLPACGAARLESVGPTPVADPAPHASATSVPTATLEMHPVELARMSGYSLFLDGDSVEKTTFSFWIPGPYEETRGQWESGQYLAAAAEAINDYAYDVYAANTLFTASDTTFYRFSPHANECADLTPLADVSRVEFALRTGQDPQLGGMNIANYAGLLAIAIQGMEGEHPGYPQSSEPFTGPALEAWRLISPFDLPEYNGRRNNVTYIDYILKDADRIWVLTFSVDTHLFWEENACAYLLGEFDSIARTFEVSPD